MGLCFSKKKPPATPAGGAKKPGKVAAAIAGDDKGKKTAQQPNRAAKATGEAADAGKASVFVVRAKDAAPTGGEEKKKRPGSHEPAAEKPLPVVVVPSAPVRTSSCTKEEVDAILIQCGRLSRSSSGTGRAASSETGGHRRRRSESKRSYDFDQDARPAGADEDWERQGAAAVSRPSPHRGSPQRKRSGSRERSGGGSGSRRASRSPGRRTDGAAAGSGGGERGRQQQPGKMVSVPAREKGRAPSPAAAASGKRCASPRSSSPARMVVGNENAGCGLVTGPTPALSRSSSRKAEQSPYRRNPMAELDENSLRNNNNNNHNAKPQKKSIENAIAATPKKKATERGKESTVAPSCRSGMEKKTEITEEDATVVVASETRAPSSKTSATRTASVVAESLSQRQPVCRSRRASRDFDQNPGGSYTTTQLLEDIHSYHQQSSTSIAVPATTPATPSFSLPACVAKACSIVEAVADLNSTSSENRTYEYEPGFSADDKGSVNAGRVEPSAAAATARKHAQPAREFRAEAEPQESAGSNSVVSGQPWTPSWEPTSVESTDRTWSTGDEVVEQSGSYGARCSPMNNRARQSKQRSSQMEPSGRSRAGSGNGNTLHRGRSAHCGSSSSVASGRSGVRVVSAAS